MIRGAFLLGFALAGLAARDSGCGGVDSPTNGENAPCTRDKDCRDGFTCKEGVCVPPDAGVDASDAQVKDVADDAS